MRGPRTYVSTSWQVTSWYDREPQNAPVSHSGKCQQTVQDLPCTTANSKKPEVTSGSENKTIIKDSRIRS